VLKEEDVIDANVVNLNLEKAKEEQCVKPKENINKDF